MTNVSPERSLSITSVQSDSFVSEFSENSTQSVDRTCSVSKTQKVSLGIIIPVCVVLMVCAIIVPIEVIRNLKKNNPPVNPVGTCTLTEYKMGTPLGVTCDVDNTVPADAYTNIVAKHATFVLEESILSQVNCSFKAADGTLSCTGPNVTCLIRGTLSISLSDTSGNTLLSTQLELSSPGHPVATSVVQVYEQNGTNLASNFNFTCAVTLSCDTYTMALYVGGNRHLTEEDATVCINTSVTDGGFNKSCVFNVDEDVIRQQRRMDISCALVQNDVVVKQEKFLLPVCSDRSLDCNCSAKTISCGEYCTKVETCLKHDASSRYQNITTRDPLLWHICPVLCTPKWCRDTFNDDKTETVTTEILTTMCTN